jgi:hypothetical protein
LANAAGRQGHFGNADITSQAYFSNYDTVAESVESVSLVTPSGCVIQDRNSVKHFLTLKVILRLPFVMSTFNVIFMRVFGTSYRRDAVELIC